MTSNSVESSVLCTAFRGLIAAIVVLALLEDLSQAKTITACISPDRGEVHIPAGTFLMGSGEHADEEGPAHQATVASFWIDRFDVTNGEFAKFIAATGYVTEAERKPNPKDYSKIPPNKLTAGGAVFRPRANGSSAEDDMEWWEFVKGANWRHPFGPKSSIAGHENEPVVQVSYNDARAYAQWVGRELPTEEQYEYAARGGLDGKTYAWGDVLTPGGKWMANVWQGHFPDQNTGEDGYRGLAPVGCFPQNGYGLYDMIGNVWKWTTSLYFPKQAASTPASRVQRVVKGGSFLCSSNYCRRFRPAARQPQESSFSSVHLGFRTVRAVHVVLEDLLQPGQTSEQLAAAHPNWTLAYWLKLEPPTVAFDAAGWYQVLAQSARIDTVIDACWKAMEDFAPARKIKLAIDEWGVFGQPGTELNPLNIHGRAVTLRDALAAALTLDTFHHHTDKLLFACFTGLINQEGGLFRADAEKFVATPIYRVFELYAAHQGALALRTVFDAPAIIHEQNGKSLSLHGLMGSASVRENQLTLTVVNPHVSQSAESSIVIRGGEVISGTVATLTDADIHAQNTFEDPERVRPLLATLKARGSELHHRFPPASVSRLTLRLRGARA
jgi:sulfatase modifying factor 1